MIVTSNGGGKATDMTWDFQVGRIDLDGLGVDAGQRLGMVFAQSEYELIPDGEVPFRISDAFRNSQKELIEKAFQIRHARVENVAYLFLLLCSLKPPFPCAGRMVWSSSASSWKRFKRK